ncbi:MAG: helix-turn-helix transcriptional regulator [Solirubrobacteraceae bacterium]|nr:helix-turn-helix transcriptional regulator [Solirubrobacteraceae bacterium]
MTHDRSNLRSDAQENHDRLLRAAAAAFAKDGASASLKAIAQDAGVGIGTLYRRFPTRDDLVEATFRSEVAMLCEAAEPLLRDYGAAEGLRRWGLQFLTVTRVKHAMIEALPGILAPREGLGTATRSMVLDAITLLLAAGERDGTLRSDVQPNDVMMALAAVGLIAQRSPADPGIGQRLLDLFVDGLANRGTHSRPD